MGSQRMDTTEWLSLTSLTHSQQKSPRCRTCMQSWKWQNGLSSFPRQTIQYHSNPSLCYQVASVVSDSVRPHRWQLTRLCRLWDSPGKNTGWVAISFSNAWKWKGKVKLVYAPTTNAKEAEVQWFYEDLKDLLELTPTKKKKSFSS